MSPVQRQANDRANMRGLGDALTEAFTRTPRPLALVRVDGRAVASIVAANAAFARLTGRSQDDLLDRDLLDVLGLGSPGHERELLSSVARGVRDSASLTSRLLRPDSSVRSVATDITSAAEGPNGAHWLLAGVTDTTEDVLATEARRLHDVMTRVLAAAASVEGSISALLPAMGDALGFTFGAAWSFDAPTGQLRCTALWEAAPGTHAYAGISREISLAPGSGLPGRVRETGRPASTPDLSAGPACPRSAAATQDQLRAAVAFPIFVGTELRCVFEFATAGRRAVGEPLTTLLEELSVEMRGLLARKGTQERPTGRAEVLLVEDNPVIARLVAEMLHGALDLPPELVHVERLADARDRLLSSRPACVLLDLSLPDAQGLQALLEVRSVAPDVPVVVLTGTEDDELAVRAMQEGAQDYLVKRHVDMDGLTRAIRYAIERKGAEQQLLEHGLRDRLTGLPNRVLLLDRLRVALGRSGAGRVSVLLLNLDRFRLLNDSLGYEWGDRLLVAAAQRIVNEVPAGATVASFGGDEFAVLVEGDSADETLQLAERLAALLSEPYDLAAELVHITATVGIAIGSAVSGTAELLVSEADTALARGKELNGGRCEVYDQALRDRLRERLALETGLRNAIENDQLVLHYQPLVVLDTREVAGFEALVRWQHPERGLVPPGAFLPLAEESGLIVPIGRWALREATRQLAAWDAEDPQRGQLIVHVNLSASELAEPDLVETVTAALDSAGIAPGRLCLEVTETALIGDLERSARTLAALRELGVGLALDDFGTGYSSLNYLERFPVDQLKLDRSFVAALDGQGKRAIVSAVATMAAALGLPALAEGIETEGQLEQLRRLGYTLGQGYLFGRPVPAEDALRPGSAVEAAAA